jgi:hypothetical protein
MGMGHGASNMILEPKDKVQNGKHRIHHDQNIMHQNHADYILRFQRNNKTFVPEGRTANSEYYQDLLKHL